jgi:hypothetical protein
MRRLLVMLAAVMIALVAAPATAVWKGQVCKDFRGPDGDGGVHLFTCLVVDDHDFEDQIRALSYNNANAGNGPAEVHVSYLHLVKNNVGTVKNTGSFINIVNDGAPETFSTTWLNNPNGTFHSRIRMWVCWPSLAGDPCGSVVIWNSGNASY